MTILHFEPSEIANIKHYYPIVTTIIFVIYLAYPSLYRLLTKPKKISGDMVGLMVDTTFGAFEAMGKLALDLIIIILYLLSWILYFVIF